MGVTGLSATGAVGDVFIWSDIDTSQTPNYAVVDTSQTPGWQNVAAF